MARTFAKVGDRILSAVVPTHRAAALACFQQNAGCNDHRLYCRTVCRNPNGTTTYGAWHVCSMC